MCICKPTGMPFFDICVKKVYVTVGMSDYLSMCVCVCVCVLTVKVWTYLLSSLSTTS